MFTMGKKPEAIKPYEGYTRVYFCPANDKNDKKDVDISFSGTLKAWGGGPIGQTTEIACRYNISDPVHMDLAAIVAIPISAVANGFVQLKAVALTRAQEIFRPSQ